LIGLPCAWRLFKKEEAKEAEKMGVLPKNELLSDLHIHLVQADIDEKRPIEVTVPCAGCMLMKRKVFESVKYRFMVGPNGERKTDDSYFVLECRKKNFSIFCHTGVKCSHLVSGKLVKDKDGKFFHPVWDER
jgi:hypothetical protein